MELALCGISIHWFFTKKLLNQCSHASLVSMLDDLIECHWVVYTGTRHWNRGWPEILYWLNSSKNELSNQRVGVLRNVTLELFSIWLALFSKLNSILLNICVPMLTNTVNWCVLSWIDKRCYHPKLSSFGFYYSIQVFLSNQSACFIEIVIKFASADKERAFFL